MDDLSQASDAVAAGPPAPGQRTPVSLLDLFACFFKIGVTSFGGSTQAWIFRAIVEERKWLGENDFLAAVTLARILPGANSVNLSLYSGQRLRGALGGLVATLGMIGPTICIGLLAGTVYARFAAFSLTHSLLLGIGAVGLGATLAAGAKVARKLEPRPRIVVVGLATFIGVGVMHWSMVPVVLVLSPISVYWASRRTAG